MYLHRVRPRPSLVITVFCLSVVGAVSTSAEDVLRIYGPEGPYPAVREAAQVFSSRNDVRLEVVADPINKWFSKAKGDADLLYSSAEFMMIDFVHGMEGRIDESSITPLYWRPSAILVRPAIRSTSTTSRIYCGPASR